MNNTIDVQVCGNQGMFPCTYKTVVLKPNIINDKNILNQGMMNMPNTKYVIKSDFIIDTDIVNGSVNVSTSNVSRCGNPAYAEALAAYNLAHDAWIAADNAYTNNPNETTLAAKNAAYAAYQEAEATLNGTPQYYYYANKAITVKKGRSIVVADGCVLLDSTLSHIVGFDVAPADTIVYIGSTTAGTYAYNIRNAIVIPSGCLIEFDGGSISDGVFIGNKTILIFDQEEEVVLKNVELLGDFEYSAGGSGGVNKKDNVNGMATITLKKNKTFASQLTQPNTIYRIMYDFDLNGKSVTIPANCVLQFDGGSLSNGTILCKDSNYVITGGLFSDVALDLSNCYTTINDCKFDSVSLVNILHAVDSSFSIDNCFFSGNTSSSFILSEGFSDTKDINVRISNSILEGNAGEWVVRLVGVYNETTYKLNAKLYNVTINAFNSPYSVVGYNCAEVVGGDFSGGSDAKPNLYNCFHGRIIGGYYHDMNRGATLGGYLGINGFITNVFSENLTSHGICVDYANAPSEGEEKDTSEGFVIVSNNMVKNCRYGIFTQTPNIQIVNNRIITGQLSERFGIRVNCQRKKRDEHGNITSEPIDNPNILIAQNVIEDLENNVTPIYLGENVKAECRDNICLSSKGYAGYDSSLFMEKTTMFIKEASGILAVDPSLYNTFVITSDVVAGFGLRFKAMPSPTIKTITVINNSDVRVSLLTSPQDSDSYLNFENTQLNSKDIGVIRVTGTNNALVEKIDLYTFGTSIPHQNDPADNYFYIGINKRIPLWGTGIDDYFIEADGAKALVNRIGKIANAPNMSDIYKGFRFLMTDDDSRMHNVYHAEKHKSTKIQEIAVAVGITTVTTANLLSSGVRYAVYISRGNRRALYACKTNQFSAEDSILLAETIVTGDTLYFTAPDPSVYPYLYCETPEGHSSQVNFVIYEAIVWVDYDGATAGVKRSGTSADRPIGSDIYVGFMYFDSSLSPARPIYASIINNETVTWVDATGATV